MRKANKKIIRISSIIVVCILTLGIILPHIKESKVKAEYEESIQTLRETPAAEYCQNNGGTLKIASDEKTGIFGICNFNDGSSCEILEYFRGECLSTTEQQQETEDLYCSELSTCEDEEDEEQEEYEEPESLSSWIESMNNIEDINEENIDGNIMDGDNLDEYDFETLYDYYENEFSNTGNENREPIGESQGGKNEENQLLSACNGVGGSILGGRCFLSNGIEIVF